MKNKPAQRRGNSPNGRHLRTTQKRRFYEFRQLRERADQVIKLLGEAAVADDGEQAEKLNNELKQLELKAESLIAAETTRLRKKGSRFQAQPKPTEDPPASNSNTLSLS